MTLSARRRCPALALALASLALGGCTGVRVADPQSGGPEDAPSGVVNDPDPGDGEAVGLDALFGLEAESSSGVEAEDSATGEPEPGFELGGLFTGEDETLPPGVAAEVKHDVELFHAGRARETFRKWLPREGRYRDLIVRALRAAGLPEELLYLAMLESGFSATVVSHAGAVGLWQFMRGTGRRAGLRIDSWVDERRDPVAATRAAVEHLSALHEDLGDWALAAAAYNAGLGRVRRARAGSNAGYFELVREGRLPTETGRYVPLILAAAHVDRNRDRYGFDDIVDDPPLAYDTVWVPGRTRLSALARAADLPAAEVAALNPHLVRGAAPPGDEYPVRVPVSALAPDFRHRLAALPLEERILPEYREVWVVVKKGDTLWGIARSHGISVATLRARNHGVGDLIRPGMRLLIERRIVTDAELTTAH